jgi:hypothetical protein
MMGSRTQEASTGVSFSYARYRKLLKGRIWGQLEMYLQNPGCDLYGEVLDIHEHNDERSFVSGGGGAGSCTLNPALVERLEVTNAFSRCRDEGVINKKQYYFIKDFNRRPRRSVELEYNALMHVVTGEMVKILHPERVGI